MTGPGKLRFPAIVTPRTATQDIKESVKSIRERIEAIEAALDAATKTAAAGIAALNSTVTGTVVSTTATGNIQQFGTVSAIAGGVAVYMSGNNVVAVADPTILAQCFGCIGVTTGVATGGKVGVAMSGSVIPVSLGVVPFRPVFVGQNGLLTQSPPPAPAVIQVGVALAAGLMLVAPAPTLLDSTALTNTTIDDLLPIARNPGVVWQFNNVTVAARRIVDFIAGAGFTMSMQDDPGNNRVVITFGTTIAAVAGLTAQDEWDWLADDQLEDAWDSWAIDSQANPSTVTPSVLLSLQDNVDPDHETADDWEVWITADSQANQRSAPARILTVQEAPWTELGEDVHDEWFWFQEDSRANSSTVVGAAVLSVEDAWREWDETEDDLWYRVASISTGWNQNG